MWLFFNILGGDKSTMNEVWLTTPLTKEFPYAPRKYVGRYRTAVTVDRTEGEEGDSTVERRVITGRAR